MNYTEKIIDMVRQMKNNNFLEIIYYFTKTMYEKEKLG